MNNFLGIATTIFSCVMSCMGKIVIFALAILYASMFACAFVFIPVIAFFLLITIPALISLFLGIATETELGVYLFLTVPAILALLSGQHFLNIGKFLYQKLCPPTKKEPFEVVLNLVFSQHNIRGFIYVSFFLFLTFYSFVLLGQHSDYPVTSLKKVGLYKESIMYSFLTFFAFDNVLNAYYESKLKLKAAWETFLSSRDDKSQS